MARKEKPASDPTNFPAMFEYLGVDLSQKATSGQVKGVCPFCGDSDPKFFVNVKTGQWDCKHCARDGNAYTFFHQLWKWSLGETTDKQYRGLSTLRGIPVETLRDAQLAFSAVTQEWLYPIHGNKDNSLTTLAVWRDMGGKKTWQWVIGTTSHCFTSGPDTSQEDWVCEGLWDMLVLSLVAKEHTVPPFIIGLPGCGSHHATVVQHAAGRTVKLFLDNDDSGHQAMDKLVEKLQPCQPASVQRIQWSAKTTSKYDVNDLWRDNSKYKSAKVRTAKKTYRDLHKHLQNIPIDTNFNPLPEGGVLDVRLLSDLVPQEVPWLWQHRLMDASVNLVQGDPGIGKSFIYCDMAARVSTGTAWPDGAACPQGDVLILSDEDDPTFTLLPRIVAQGGDPTRIRFLHGVLMNARPTETEAFSVDRDLDKLSHRIRELGAYRLIIIDGLVTSMSTGVDANRANGIGGVIKKVNAMIARAHQVCVVATIHTNKGSLESKAMHRGQGSISIVGTARTAHEVCNTDDGLVMLPVKISNAKKPMGLKYHIDDTGLHWNGFTDLDADDTDALRPTSRLKRVQRWIKDYFGQRTEVLAEEIEAAAAKAGFTARTLRRARTELQIESKKKAGKNKFFWIASPDMRFAKNLQTAEEQGVPVFSSAKTRRRATVPFSGKKVGGR